MADLIFKGEKTLNLGGTLNLAGDGGGKVKVGEDEVLVLDNKTQYTGVPVPIVDASGNPIDAGTTVKITGTLNATVTVNNRQVVTMGFTIQGDKTMWPGMVLPSTKNQTVMINSIPIIPINVVGDSAMTLPNAGTVPLDKSGQ